MPPSDFVSHELIIAELPTGSVWYRVYRSGFPDPLGYGLGSSRFSDPEISLCTPDRFGVVYFGSSIKVCFAEAILRDRGVGAGPSLPIELAELQELSCAEIETVAPLRLADFRGDGMLRMRIPTDAARATPHVGDKCGHAQFGCTRRNLTASSRIPV
jgi:hypothetical protein